MGQKKIQTMDLSQTDQAENKQKPSGKAKTTKKAKETDKAKSEKPVKAETKTEAKTKKKTVKKAKKARVRSKRYQALKKTVKTEKYALAEAVKLLLELANTKIDETIELHLMALEKLNGTLKLPHGTGKTQTIEIASDKTLAKLAKGQIDFEILIAEPAMMAKLAKYAKLLGPKGLMPNPKNGTISPDPKAAAEKFNAGEIHYKTETKFPLLHLTIGKVSFGEQKLLANLKAALEAVKLRNIVKATLTSTHSPGIKLEFK